MNAIYVVNNSRENVYYRGKYLNNMGVRNNNKHETTSKEKATRREEEEKQKKKQERAE